MNDVNADVLKRLRLTHNQVRYLRLILPVLEGGKELNTSQLYREINKKEKINYGTLYGNLKPLAKKELLRRRWTKRATFWSLLPLTDVLLEEGLV